MNSRNTFPRFLLVVSSALAMSLPASAQDSQESGLRAALDSVALAHLEHELVAGVSVAVVRGGDTLLLKGYGLVDLEWGIPTPEDASATYEIGSMTKQFTAAAILRLVEEGKLDLEADFTEYLPEFDSGGAGSPFGAFWTIPRGSRAIRRCPSSPSFP